MPNTPRSLHTISVHVKMISDNILTILRVIPIKIIPLKSQLLITVPLPFKYFPSPYEGEGRVRVRR
jgi:hypothetical protein